MKCQQQQRSSTQHRRNKNRNDYKTHTSEHPSPAYVKMTFTNDAETEAAIAPHETVPDTGGEERACRLAAVGYDDPRSPQPTAVQDFFSGRYMLVTGVTGFVGKVLVEKLLRSCPGVETIYALIRPKKGVGVQQRLQDILSKPVFRNIGKEQRLRLVAVAGDVAQPGLGLSPGDAATLRHRVSVVFHVAATVRFDEQLRVAAATNVLGTWEVLRLAREMPNLKAVVHTSTAYSQCVQREVREHVCGSPMSAAYLLQICGGLQEGSDLQRILGPYPNTYTFTKAVAEHLIQQEFRDLPVAIIRPSMVVATRAEPLPGWADSLNGPMAVAAPSCCGVLRVFYCDASKRMDLMPCDMVVGCMLAAAWDVATGSGECAERPRVYNQVSSVEAPLRYSDYIEQLHRHTAGCPPSAAVWSFALWATRCRPVYLLCRLLLHLLPAYIMDCVALLTNRKPLMRKIYRKVHAFNKVVEFFVTHDWEFETQQTKALWSRLSAEDRALLAFDPGLIHWDSYFGHYVRGVRQFLLKDEMDTLPAARLRYRRLLWLHRSVKIAALLLLLAAASVIIYAVVYCLM